MLMRHFILSLLCASAVSAHAQPPSPSPPHIRARMILSDRAAMPIQLQQLSISADISGGMAETTVRMVFFNPNHRQLEGNLQFPLAKGQQITAFALDIDGVMRPAVPVDKARGRMVFDAIERRQVDPGLLEVTQGNNFKLRVYPILAQGTRTVELRYSEPLARRAGAWAYRLPLAYGEVRNFDLKLKVNGSDAAPLVEGLQSGLEFKPVKDGYQATLSRQRHHADGTIDIVTRAAASARVYRQDIGNTAWFVAEIPVKSTRTARPRPPVVGLLWDSSGSGANRQIDAELAELERYFSALGTVEVRLTRLRDRPEAQQVFRIEGGNWSALRRALEQTVYDGASALNDWRAESSVDQYLLFSDGLSNYGGATFPTLAPRQRLFALNSALSADTGRLAALAERHGGQLIGVDRATPGTAAQALLFQDAHIDDISASGATEIEVDSHTVRNGMLRVAGRLLSPQAQLTLTVTNAGKSEKMTVPLAADAAHHPRAGATWASFRLRSLEADFELHRGEIGRIGRRFGIPTRETSLIVLEQMDDYVRYEIEPPPHMAAEYEQRKRALASGRGEQRSKHFDSVVQMYEQRKAWWKTDFIPKKVVPKPSPRAVRPHEPGVPSNSAPRAVAMAPQHPMAERVDVTGSLSRHDAESAPLAMMLMAPAPVASAASAELKSKDQSSSGETAKVGMQLKKWMPNAPYMDRLNQAPADKVYQVYLDQKADNTNSSAFFLDAADILFAKGHADLALRVLSNLSEMDLENRAVLRILGYRLLQAKAPQLAVPVFEQVRRIAIEEPQSFRDLGLALAAAGRPQEAIDTLYEVALRPWDRRFPDIESIALAELNAIIAASPRPLDVSRIDKRLLVNLPLALRVVLTWDADNSDMDLHVTDPDGERCYYSHPRTEQGGNMTRDFTGGYGPEEFSLRRAKPGKYRIEAQYYGSGQQVLAGATTLQVKMFSGFGTAKEKMELVTLRLKDKSEMVFVGEFEVMP